MKRKTCIIVSLFLALVALAAQASPSSPESAVELFMQGIKEASLEKVFSACACKEAADGFNLPAYTDHMGVFIPQLFNAEPNSDFYRAINRSKLESKIAEQVKLFSWVLLFDGKLDLSNPHITDPSLMGSLKQGFDATKLKGIKLLRVDFPHDSLEDNERNLKNWRRNATFYGAEEYTERVALFSFNGVEWYSGFTLVRYGSVWKVLTMVSSLGNTTVYGEPCRTTTDIYLSTFKDAFPEDEESAEP